MDFRERAYNKMQEVVTNGKNNVGQFLTDIAREFDVRRDFIAKPRVIDYDVTDGRIVPIVNEERLNLTPHSEGQMYGRLGIPKTYGERLLELGETELLHNNLKRMTQRNSEEGTLFRVVDGSIKGWLSTSYKRMDASPIFSEYIQTMLNLGFVPQRGSNTTYRYHLAFLMPEVIELVPNEFVVFGSSITTGDYGSVALSMEEYIMRVICTNMMIGTNAFRKIHIGKRFDSDTNTAYASLSNETHRKDSEAIASAVKDVTLGAKFRIEALAKSVKENVSKDININQAIAELKKSGIPKKVTEAVQTVYEQDAINELLPPSRGAWRLSNAISLVAQSQPPDLQLDMEKEAMGLLTGK